MPSLPSLLARLRQHRLAPLLALLLGGLMPLTLAPWNVWPLALPCIALFSELLRDQRPRAAAWGGFCFGFGLWAVGASWLYVSIHDYGNTPMWLAVPMVGLVAAVMALFFAAVGWLQGRFFTGRAHNAGFAALFVLGEWLRSWLLTGFPWLFTGYAFLATPLQGYAPVVGVFGVSLAAIASAQWLARLLLEPTGRVKTVLLLVALWGAGAALDRVTWTQVSETPLTVSVVQGNIPQEDKWQTEWRDKTLDRYLQMSASEWGRDLVIWPEAAMPLFLNEAEDVLGDIDDRAKASNSTFMTGILYAGPGEGGHKYRFYNSMIALGNGSGLYSKQRLVPFGEFVPMGSLLRGLIPFFDLPMSGFTEGEPDQPPLLAGHVAIAPNICYEIAYPDLVRRSAMRADLLVTISNDGWFGHSSGPLQHFQLVQMRALETGRQIISATNTGVSAVVDEKGRVTARAPQFRQLVLRAPVHASHGLTPYVAMGNAGVLLVCGGLLLLGRRARRQQAVLQ